MSAVQARSGTGTRAPMQVRVRAKGTEMAGLDVLDLSLAGCMIHKGSWMLREEQRVMVSLPTIANLPAMVLWVENDRAGLLFDQLLNEAVYEHLVGGYALGGGR